MCLLYKGEPIAGVVIRQSLTRVSDLEKKNTPHFHH